MVATKDYIDTQILNLKYLINDRSVPIQPSIGYIIDPQNYTLQDKQVTELKDIAGNNHLTQSDQSKQPILRIDNKNRFYLRFNQSFMVNDAVNSQVFR